MQAGSATPCIREVFRFWCIQSGNVGLMQTFTPANQTELAAVLAEANESGLGVIPAGGGTKSAWEIHQDMPTLCYQPVTWIR